MSNVLQDLNIKGRDESGPLYNFHEVKSTSFFLRNYKKCTPVSFLARMIRLYEMLVLAEHSSGSILRKRRETRDYFSYNFSPPTRRTQMNVYMNITTR